MNKIYLNNFNQILILKTVGLNFYVLLIQNYFYLISRMYS